MKRCYYEVLQVDNKATSGQIKSSYRKLALKYHPDKNSSEDAKTMFVQITQAYNVLADPNQRTWYDSNREKILFNKEQMTKQDLEMYSFGFNIWTYFTVSCFKDYSDQQGGFFQVYRQVFQKIKTQQTKAFKARDDLEEEMRKYQGFGDSQTNMEKALKFYEDWQNFTTYKTFIWSEEWDTRQAQNRWVKRQMQKENKKQRLKQKKTYIKTIKDLISFLRKRDPRYRQYLFKVKQEQQKKEQQKKLRQIQKKREKQQQKKVKEVLEQERFKQIQEYYKNQNIEQGNLNNHNNYQQQEISPFYCAVCDKQFKSQNQLHNHQNSKMHKQNVKIIEKQVLLKEQILNQAQKIQQTKIQEPVQKKKKKRNKNKNKNQQNNSSEQEGQQKQKQKQKQKPVQTKKQQPLTANNNKKKQQPNKKDNKKKQQSSDEQVKKPVKKTEKQSDYSSDDEDAFMSLVKNQKNNKIQEKVVEKSVKDKKKENNQKIAENLKNMQESQSQEDQSKKIGKAKLKKQKKAEQQKQKQKQGTFKCNSCKQAYPSKTKLFDHIKKTGHAAAK